MLSSAMYTVTTPEQKPIQDLNSIGIVFISLAKCINQPMCSCDKTFNVIIRKSVFTQNQLPIRVLQNESLLVQVGICIYTEQQIQGNPLQGKMAFT